MGVLAAFAAAAALFSHSAGHYVVRTPAYRVVLDDRTGRIVEVDDAQGRRVLGGSWGCLWWLNADHHATSLSGCSIRPRAAWRAGTLTLTYGAAATVTLHALPAYFDLRLRLGKQKVTRDHVLFPAGLAGDTRTVQAGYVPDVLPGLQLKPAFFSRVVDATQIYPGRWAFADYLALDAGGGHAAVYTVNTGPIAPVHFGFLHLGGAVCSGRVFCLFHEFQTWVEPGQTWTSPVVRVRVGETAQQTILDYRRDNGIDAYPSLASKLGARLATLERAPLVKADVPRIGLPFSKWAPLLAQLPSPVVLHPVAYQPGGHDENDPDFLPPAPEWGTTADLAALIGAAHALGDDVMPYDDPTWWAPSSPTMQGTTTAAVAATDSKGAPQTIDYGDHQGIIVSPWSPVVQARTKQELDTWQSLGADCVFFDQLGARPWLPDFFPGAPSPLAYDDGWLQLLAPYRDRCVMVEDGWDRLAADAVGFHGGVLMMQRELQYVDHYFGAGNWQPYPLATWLVHDKVLMYQHDLFPLTMAIDGEVVTWNLAFGLVQSVEWHVGQEHDPWLELAARLQEDFGPLYAGVPLSSFTQVAPGVTKSVFGTLTVEANLSSKPYDGIDADGVKATVPDGSLSVQTFPGGHWVIEERQGTTTIVRQPVGGDIYLSVEGRSVTTLDGAPVQSAGLDGALSFTYQAGAPGYIVR
ncbi:MAG: hypothetical protein ABUS54_09165 [Actinomycetota bacterium]